MADDFGSQGKEFVWYLVDNMKLLKTLGKEIDVSSTVRV